MLKRYWFSFEDLPKHSLLQFGCGVTAHDYDDAISLLHHSIFKGDAMPPIKDVIEDVDISTLDRGHVIPNMEAPVWRGVWFPKGHRLL